MKDFFNIDKKTDLLKLKAEKKYFKTTMKTFLITGGHGMLGKSMVHFLLKKNFKVVILDYKRNREKK